MRKYILLLSCCLAWSKASWAWPRDSQNRRGWCEGSCANVLMCGLGGREGSMSSSCPGVLSVCCHTRGIRPEPELSRVARTLSSPRRKKRPRKGRKVHSHKTKSATRRPVFQPHTSPASHQVTPATRAPVFLPGEGTKLAKLYTTGKPYYGPKEKIQSHAVAPTQRSPVLIPSLGGPLVSPALGGPLHIPSIGGPLHIPTIGGPLLTPSPPAYRTSPKRKKRKNQALSFFEGNGIGFTTPINNEECGLSKPGSQSRILGGTDAGYGQFPWTAILTVTGPGLDKMCAGTLVQDRFILTAGHCVRYCEPGTLPNCTRRIPFSQLKFKVTLGEYDFHDKSKDRKVQRFHASEVFLHPEYQNVFRYRESGFLESEPRHDIAILKLDRKAKTSPGVGSICLASPTLWLGEGTLASVVGWGRMGVFEGAPHSTTLQAVTVPVLTREECLAEPGSSAPSPDQLCAGVSHARRTSCPGDSGGGLMVRDSSGVWTLVGIVSTGPAECGLTPVIYHDVRSSSKWIQEILQLAGGR